MHVCDCAPVEDVLPARDELKVAGFVAPVDIGPVQFQRRVVPALQREQILEKSSAVFAPRLEDVNAPRAIVAETAVVGVMAAIDAGRHAVE